MTSVQPDPTAPKIESPTPTPTGEATSSEFRYGTGPEVPEYARGKTASELLGITTQVVGALQDVARQQAFQPQPTYAPPAPNTEFKDDDIVDGRTMKAYAQQIAQQSTNPNMERQLAQVLYDNVSREPKYQETFQKWGHEVLAQLRGVPHAGWTLDTIRLAGNIVRGEHLDELVEQRAQTKLQNMQGLPIRGNGLGSANNLVDSDGLPANYQAILDRIGVTMAQVDGFCAAHGQGWDRKKWFAYYDKPSTMGSR